MGEGVDRAVRLRLVKTPNAARGGEKRERGRPSEAETPTVCTQNSLKIKSLLFKMPTRVFFTTKDTKW
jgi:hypothetical protein